MTCAGCGRTCEGTMLVLRSAYWLSKLAAWHDVAGNLFLVGRCWKLRSHHGSLPDDLACFFRLPIPCSGRARVAALRR